MSQIGACSSCEQFRRLVCGHLAACLCINYTCCTRVDVSKDAEGPDADKSAMDNEASDHHRTYLLSPAVEAAAGSRETDRLLADIRDLLRATVRDMARLRRDKDDAQRMANDWMLAAAVIDRICCIIITLFFIAGTITLVVLLFVRSAND